MNSNKLVSTEEASALLMEPVHQLEMSRLAHEALAAWAQAVSALIGRQVKIEVARVDLPSGASVTDLLAEFSVKARASFQEEMSGEVVFLFRPKDATLICDLMLGAGGEGRDALSADDKITLAEALNRTLPEYVAALKEQWGGNLSLDQATVETEGTSLSGELVSLDVQLGVEGVPDSRFIHLFPLSSAIQLLKLSAQETEHDQPSVSDNVALSELLQHPSVEEMQPPSTAAPRSELSRAELFNLDLILDIELTVVARLGEMEMPVSEILKLGPGSILEVNKLVDEPIELLVNNKLIARGDVVVVDEKFGVRIVEVVSPRERIESLK